MRFFACSIRSACRLIERQHVLHVHSHIVAYRSIDSRSFSVSARLSGFEQWGTAKKNRKVKLHFQPDMSDPQTEEALAPLRASVKEQVNYHMVTLFQHVLNLT